MDWITPEVAIGNYLEAQDADLLRRHGFRSALSLDGTLGEGRTLECGLAEVVCVRLIDGTGNDMRLFRYAVESLVRLAGSLAPVLVQCHAGRSRSAAVVAGYLMRCRGTGPEQAVAEVSSRRVINIAPALEELLFELG